MQTKCLFEKWDWKLAYINSQGSTDNLKLISIHSKRFEVRQLSTKRKSPLTNYQLTNVKLNQCLGCSSGGGNICFNRSTLLQSNKDWFRSVSQVHNPIKHCTNLPAD